MISRQRFIYFLQSVDFGIQNGVIQIHQRIDLLDDTIERELLFTCKDHPTLQI